MPLQIGLCQTLVSAAGNLPRQSGYSRLDRFTTVITRVAVLAE